MDVARYLPRLMEDHLKSVVAVQPAAVVTGARQTGKSTLVRNSPSLKGYDYLTLDDISTRREALEDPESIPRRYQRVIIDEVQRAPDLLIAIKAVIDSEGRQPGRFVLTGSANLLALRSVKETLAGRASYLNLWPLTRGERLGRGTAGRWSEIIALNPVDWIAYLTSLNSPRDDWSALVRRTAYAPMAAGNHSETAEADWMQGYMDAYVERDIAELSSISRPLDLLRLLRALAAQVGQVESQINLVRATGLARSTISRWIDLFEISYQVIRVPAFSRNRNKRLTRTPKIYWSDPAMAMQLSGLDVPNGHYLENLVLSDLIAWSDQHSRRPSIMHWRTVDQMEVDFVIETTAGRLLPIEIKSGARPGWDEVAGLRSFLTEYPDLAVGALVLHGGEETYTLGHGIVAAPWWRII